MVLGLRSYCSAEANNFPTKATALVHKIRKASVTSSLRSLEELRTCYFDDSLQLLDLLSGLSEQLQSYPASRGASGLHQRLQIGLNRINQFLRGRADSLTSLHSYVSIPDDSHARNSNVNEGKDSGIQLPLGVLDRILHFPLQRSDEAMLRVLNVVTEHCAILPSKDRCPYLLVMEVVKQDGAVGSDAGVFGAKTFRDTAETDSSSVDLPPGLVRAGSPPADRSSAGADETMSSDQSSSGPSREHVSMVARIADTGDDDEHLKPSEDPAAAASTLTGPDSESSDQTDVAPPRSTNVNDVSVVLRTSACLESEPAAAQAAGMRYRRRVLRGRLSTPLIISGSRGSRERAAWHDRHHKIPQQGLAHLRPELTAGLTSFRRPSRWAERVEDIRKKSPLSHLRGWAIKAFIVKGGAADLRREALAMQFINYFQSVFAEEKVDIALRPYRILTTGPTSGLVEYLTDTSSVDYIKKSQLPADARLQPQQQQQRPQAVSAGLAKRNVRRTTCLREYFESTFGPAYSTQYAKALNNFVRSLAGYSLVTYLLQVKDRHNGNILIDSTGKIVHIDFGFILGESPAFNLNFEAAPFKLTAEYVDLMGGLDSPAYRLFQDLFVKGFFALQKRIVPILAIGEGVFGVEGRSGGGAMQGLRKRLELPQSPEEVRSLLEESVDNWRTSQYDWFQQQTNDIMM